jgi:hypothetical protein
MHSERRRAVRYHFGGVAEVIDTMGKQCVALSTDLSSFGCFLKTTGPFPAETVVDVRITHEHVQFFARGRVTHSHPNKGMGIAFGPIEPLHQAVLQKWLTEAAFNESFTTIPHTNLEDA